MFFHVLDTYVYLLKHSTSAPNSNIFGFGGRLLGCIYYKNHRNDERVQGLMIIIKYKL